MATFPTLKTGAIAQYPLERSVQFPLQSVRFLNGSRQNYRLSGRGLRKWSIRLNLLDEAEVAALIAFVEEQKSSAFDFTDPVTGSVVTKCVIGGEQFRAGLDAKQEGWSEMNIEEVL